MALKTFNPTSEGRRQLVIVDRSELHKGRPEKSLVEGLTKSGGRNNAGRVTAFRHGGGHKRLYRKIDFKRRRWNDPATIVRLEYDPNRTAWLALIQYKDGDLAYIIAPQKVKAGDVVVAGEQVDVKPGNAMLLKNVPVGTIVHNIELKPQKGAQMIRSAGSYAQVVGRDAGYVQLRLASGETRMVQDTCMATIGAVSNPDNMNENWGKAGRSIWLGRKPAVRGVAMNPVDHPHGGGEGRTSGGRHPTTPWGKKTRGPKTRNNKKTDRLIIRRRNDKKA